MNHLLVRYIPDARPRRGMLFTNRVETITANECLDTHERRLLRANGLTVDGRRKYLKIPDYVPDEAILTTVDFVDWNWARETSRTQLTPEARPVCICGGFLDQNANAPNGVGNRCRDHFGKHRDEGLPVRWSGKWEVRTHVTTTHEKSLANPDQAGKTAILGEAPKTRASKAGAHSGGEWETYGLWHLATVRMVSKKSNGYRFTDRSQRFHTTSQPHLGTTIFTLGMKANGKTGIIPVHPIYADTFRVMGLRYSTNPRTLLND